MENGDENTRPRWWLNYSSLIIPDIPLLRRSVAPPPNLSGNDDPFIGFDPTMTGNTRRYSVVVISKNQSSQAGTLNQNPPLSGGLATMIGHGSGGVYPLNAWPLDVCVDIPKEDDRFTQLFDRLLEKKSSEWDYSKMSGPVQVIATQAIAGMMAYTITDSSYPLWAKCVVGGGAVGGMCLTAVAGSGMSSSKQRKMIKAGGIAIAWATFVSLGMQLPKLAAWTFGPVAALITTAAVVLA